MNLYGYGAGDPINNSDPFGLCPKSGGGDGKTDDTSDCPRGTSGWWAHRDAQGQGSSVVNNVMGMWAVLNSDPRARLEASLPADTELALGVFDLPIGRGGIAKLAGETGNFRHAIKMLGLNKNAASKELHAKKKAAGLRGADNVWINSTTGAVRDQATGELIGSLIP